jgi:hypothetical protein
MALGKRRDASTITPLIKFDARSGKTTRCDREQDSSGKWTTKDVDISDTFEAVFDLENIEIGWIAFKGGRPDFKMVKAGADIGDPPSKDHKEGFRLRLKLINGAGSDVRELSSTAKAVWMSIDELHDEFLEAVVKHKTSEVAWLLGFAEVSAFNHACSCFFVFQRFLKVAGSLPTLF